MLYSLALLYFGGFSKQPQCLLAFLQAASTWTQTRPCTSTTVRISTTRSASQCSSTRRLTRRASSLRRRRRCRCRCVCGSWTSARLSRTRTRSACCSTSASARPPPGASDSRRSDARARCSTWRAGDRSTPPTGARAPVASKA